MGSNTNKPSNEYLAAVDWEALEKFLADRRAKAA